MAKEKKKPNNYVLKKTHDTQIGVMKHEIKRIEDGIVANFTTGKTDNTVIDVNVGGNKVTYADGMIANSVALKNGLIVSYDTGPDGKATVSVNKGEDDITNTAAGKQAARDALKAILKADGVVAEISGSRDSWKNLPNFKGLYSWASEAKKKFETRQKIAEARQKLLDVQSKGYANGLEFGAKIGDPDYTPEQAAKDRKKEEAEAAAKGKKLGKAQQEIREEQRQQKKQDILDRDAAYRKALAEQRD